MIELTQLAKEAEEEVTGMVNIARQEFSKKRSSAGALLAHPQFAGQGQGMQQGQVPAFMAPPPYATNPPNANPFMAGIPGIQSRVSDQMGGGASANPMMDGYATGGPRNPFVGRYEVKQHQTVYPPNALAFAGIPTQGTPFPHHSQNSVQEITHEMKSLGIAYLSTPQEDPEDYMAVLDEAKHVVATASAFISTAEKAMQEATGTDGRRACFGCAGTKYDKFKFEHLFTNCPNKGDPEVRRRGNAKLQELCGPYNGRFNKNRGNTDDGRYSKQIHLPGYCCGR